MKADPLADLRNEFRRRAARDRVALMQCLDADDVEQIERIVHGLAGSAGMFGFSDVGAAALTIDDVFASGRGLDVEAVKRLIAALEALIRSRC